MACEALARRPRMRRVHVSPSGSTSSNESVRTVDHVVGRRMARLPVRALDADRSVSQEASLPSVSTINQITADRPTRLRGTGDADGLFTYVLVTALAISASASRRPRPAAHDRPGLFGRHRRVDAVAVPTRADDAVRQDTLPVVGQTCREDSAARRRRTGPPPPAPPARHRASLPDRDWRAIWRIENEAGSRSTAMRI